MVTQTTAIILGIIGVAVIVGIGTGVVPFDFAQQGGVVTPPVTVLPTAGITFFGQLNIVEEHVNGLDNTDARTEGVELTTTYYTSNNGNVFNTIGDGNSASITIDRSMNGIIYAGLETDAFTYVDPMGTADQGLNPFITFVEYRDVSGDGQKTWIFRMDLRNIPAPIAGQTFSTIAFRTLSWDDTTPPLLNSPPDITGIGTTSGTSNFIRWEMTVTQAEASAQFEYELEMDTDDNNAWDRGRSNLDIPMVGIITLSSFDEQITSGVSVIYRLKIGDTAELDSANYVLSLKNGNEVHNIPANIVTNFGAITAFNVTLSLNTIDADRTTGSVTDTVLLNSV